ncbi:MAG: Type III restriction enzyme, res subunit [Bacteroidetes bacterium ADurb.BinA261]|nr:MAG: Type III restriction enzyme, res subunit [Bacteroidetes bacterium ADurb.BinA261]
MSTFQSILNQFRKESFSQKDKGERFERLMQLYLLTEPYYANLFTKVWLWNEFPFREDLGGNDTGIDLVAKTTHGAYWAIQCKCYQENAVINKPAVDSFLTTAGRSFVDDSGQTKKFEHCLWISTTNHWGSNAEEAIRNHTPAVSRISLFHLQNSSVDWDKLLQGMYGEQSRKPRKTPFEHQEKAIANSLEYFKFHDRGKLIMACGTGKTFTSLKIAEQQTNGRGLVLFLVPSIALLGQTLDEWTNEAAQPINAICICSDAEVSKKKVQNEDTDTFSVVDLALPASTDVPSIMKQFREALDSEGMTVVFSTYQSIEVISNAQKEYQKVYGNESGIFDLIICDEAHRTTGVTLSDEDESAFVKVHDNNFIQGRKRMYMTATPRLYSDDTKKKAVDLDAVLCSMDDVKLYGDEMYHIGFGEAVEKGLLSDYKVLILTVNENDMPVAVQEMVSNSPAEVPANDVNKLIGCVNALSKEIVGDNSLVKSSDPEPMHTAVAFCQNIRISKQITATFNQMGDIYYKNLSDEARSRMVMIESEHIDGTMPATERYQKLSWLKSVERGTQNCRILTNVRCLSEGVDVPSLDAVIFLSPRNSQVDVVQSVGRVMRRAPDKKYGYIIIPVVIPSDADTKKALDNNKEYAVVWTVLNALRAHDDRFNATVNKIELNRNKPQNILVGAPSYGSDDDVIDFSPEAFSDVELKLSLKFEEMQTLLYAKMVEKVGDRRYWEQWAKDIAEIAERHIQRITELVASDKKHRKAFDSFLKGLHKNINPSVSETEAIEMLAQHIITQPVFEALFENYSFVRNNPISQSMQQVLLLLEEENTEQENETLQKFYDSVKMGASKIDNAEAKQKIIVELYDKFFKAAFPKLVERLGIVYTPVEVVDFIIRSVNDVLHKEFGRSLADENIHILDPFTGTGTFITRLLQSGLIPGQSLERKYLHELHANEIVLLAYYIASVNIENVYHDLRSEPDGEYTPFDGICLTDTFQLGETRDSEELFSEIFPQNSKRVQQQQKTPLRVIIGNPPYSIGQKSANDNAQNQKYEHLDQRVMNTYVAKSTAGLNKSSYDAYIRAFRWASDRLDAKHGGVICFVSNGGWIDGNSTDGFRKSIETEFSSIYVFNLRGDARTQGERRRKEAGNVFGSGSRTPIAITLLVKKPAHASKADIYYYEVDDYLSREEKLALVKKLGSAGNPQMPWQKLHSNEHGDWINHRNDRFSEFIPLAPDKKFDGRAKAFFTTISAGISTSRDSWCYNYSKDRVRNNINRSILFYNSQVKDYQNAIKDNPSLKVTDFIIFDSKKFSWDRAQKEKDLPKGVKYHFDENRIYKSSYRPFTKSYLYFARELNNCVYQQPNLFPLNTFENNVICVSCMGTNKGLSVLITNNIPDYHYIGDTQCFPLYWYEERQQNNPTLFDVLSEPDENMYTRRDGISDFILQRARSQYGNMTKKEDVFYYVYGMLHSPQYRETFAADLKKMLPRLPLVENSTDFWRFAKAGRQLAELHLHYENYPKPNGVVVHIDTGATVDYEVVKMRFPRKGERHTILYNHQITIENIPDEAYEYVVNGKSAIEWIMERYQVTTNKDSGIVNDPNDWAREQGNPRYILDLLLSIINVSLQTVEIVRNLPALDLGDLSPANQSGDNRKTITAPASIPTEVPQSNTVKEYAIPAEPLPQVAEAKQKEEPDTKIVTLIIKKVYFDAILSGTKKVEYRQLKQTTLNKYTWLNPQDGKRHLKKYDAVRFYVGYNKNRETALIEIVNTVYDTTTQTVEFHLGRILERE